MEIQYEKTKTMFGQWLSSMLFSLKRMFRFIRGQKEESDGYTTLSRRDRLTGVRELSKLSSFETIKAKTFYQIQKNLSQISKEQDKLKDVQPEKLSQEIERLKKSWTETMNLLGTAKENYQQERWQEIVEKYYRAIDNDSFETFLKKKRKDIEWQQDYIKMILGLNLAVLGLDSGWNILNSVGIKANTIDKAVQKIRGKITNYELKKSQKPVDNKEVQDFYEMWAGVRKLGYTIDDDIKLVAWIGVLKSIKKEHERQNSKK